jgi:hypothetical protein
MRQPQKSARLRQLLRQNFEKELGHIQNMEGPTQPSDHSRLPVNGGRLKGWIIITISTFLSLGLLLAACGHFPEALPEPEKATQTFDADERIILKAIAGVLKERGFGEPQVEADKGRLETDYVVQGDWRTKVVATVKKISRKEREVTLSVITEKKSASQWQPKKLMGKEQYEKIFGEIEMQIYREWYKGE